MAPPVKYTEALAGKICGAVAAGEPVTVACRIAGISRGTIYNWLREYPDFAAKLEQAEGQRVSARLRRIDEKADRDWRADAWVLERTSPEFREVKDIKIQVETGVAQVLEAARPHCSPGAYAEFVRAVAIAQGLGDEAAALPTGDDD